MKLELFKKLHLFFDKNHNVKSWNDMSLIEKYEYARNKFQHYAIRYSYDTGSLYKDNISTKEKLYCFDMANYWDNIIKEIRNKI